MAHIYKITNLINQKVYIGETIRTVEMRWKQHLQRAKDKSRQEHLYRAMRKYGVENFVVEEIEECKDDIRFERETYHIIQHNSLEPLGYNYLICQKGSDSSLNSNLIEAVLQEWSFGSLERVICEKLHISGKTARYILTNNGITKEDIAKRKSEYIRKMSSKIVYQYTLEGDFVQSWESSQEAGRALGLNNASISKCCTGFLLTYNNYIWQYEEDDNIEEIIEIIKSKPKTGKNKKSILQIDEYGNVIQEFESASAAGRSFGKAHAGIAYAARNGGMSYGFYWKYKEEEEQ